MFKWEKLGRVFVPQEVTGRQWLKEFAQAPSTLIFDEFLRVYFSCRPPADKNGQYVSFSAFVDLDRKDPFKILRISSEPILALGGRGTFDEFGVYPTSVVRNGSTVVAYYGGWTRCESVPFNVAIGMAVSDDHGETFRRMGSGPVLSYTFDEPFILSGPKIRRFNNAWYLWYIAGKKWIVADRPEPVYRIRMARSDDGINWIRIGRDLIRPKLEENECQASPDVFFYEGMFHMFFCYRYSLNYKTKAGGYRIGYAHSSDLENWIRSDEKAGIDVSENGWDSEMVSYPHVFELDGNVYMMYLGNQVGRFGFGLAKLVV
jgi:predicted GH43/DUF377 family glycosyl hydrolase